MERKSPVAGSWYAGTEKSLKEQIHSLLINKQFGPGRDSKKEVQEKADKSIIGVISPHAGYLSSGSIAAHGFSQLYDNFKEIDTAIIIGPNHRGIGPPISIYPKGKWNLPLGSVEIDEELVKYARNWDFGILSDYVDFEETAHHQEHSLDIQLPFLQYFYENKFKLFAICLKDQSLSPVAETLSSFLKDLLDHFKNKKIIIVASTDLSHEDDYDLLLKNDQTMIDLLEKLDLNEADHFRKSNRMTMCGYGSVYTILRLAQRIGNPIVETLKYSNSGQITGRTGGGYTVGYTSMLIKAG